VVLPSLHACALVRRSPALAIGGYDESFTDSAFREESDFYARLWRSGWGCWMTPATWAVHVRHRLGGGCRGARPLARKIANRLSYWRNNSRFVDRHRRLWQRWGAAPGAGLIKLGYARTLLRDGLRSIGA
jgi:GT2 family glycosyltransferase